MARVVIAAGGTAGHVVPAIAVADELRASGADVAFVGTRERVEAELVPRAGYELHHLSVSGLDRRNPLRAARAAGEALAAARTARRLLRELRPDAVLGAGGYVAWPVGAAAVSLRVPLVLLESDSRLGMANRLLARSARRVCLSFPVAGRDGPSYLLTGRPVPRAVVEADRKAARRRFEIADGERCLLVFGGSLGARSINETALAAFGERPPLAGSGQPAAVLHISGSRDHRALIERLERLGRPRHYRLFEYLDGLAEPLAACDLVLARAGGSIFEVAAAGRPAILVPFPRATADHQSGNARWMADGGAAVVLPDAELDPQRLTAVVEGLLGDERRLDEMAAASRRLARPEAAANVAAELLSAAGETSGSRVRDTSAPWSGRDLHFVGIGGAGMSALALVAHRLGAAVSGCDRSESAYTGMLAAEGVPVTIGHAREHGEAAGELVVSTAVPADLPEVVAARERGAPVVHRGRLLGEVATLRRLIAVAGTHGKTTTAVMVAHCLEALGAEPSYLIGAELRGSPVRANGAWGDGEWLVAEADESDRSFLELSPEIAVVTNVELDHHTTYGSHVELEEAFRSFLARLPSDGAAVLLADPELRRLVPGGRRVVAYGIEDDGRAELTLAARAVTQAGLGTSFELVRSGEPLGTVELTVPGRHNVLNALAALGACEAAGLDLRRAAAALRDFRAAGRRFEPRGEGRGVRVFDDYAHHPTEVRATLEAARALEPERLIAVFQPHLFSRTLHLHRELGRELARADVAVVLDVYPSRERPEGELAGVSGKLVADACADYAGGREVWWLPTLAEAETALAAHVRSGDVVVTLGAGDVDRLAEGLAARLDGVR